MIDKSFPPKNKKYEVVVQLDLYKRSVMFAINHTDSEFEAFLRRIKPGVKNIHKTMAVSDWRDSRGMCIDMDGSGSSVIRLRTLPTKGDFVAVAAHEIFHAVEGVATSIGLKLSEKSEEAFAYMITYITEELFKKVKL